MIGAHRGIEGNSSRRDENDVCIGVYGSDGIDVTDGIDSTNVSALSLPVPNQGKKGFFYRRFMLGMTGFLVLHALYTVPSSIVRYATDTVLSYNLKTIEAVSSKEKEIVNLKQQQREQQKKRKALKLYDQNPNGKIGTIYRATTSTQGLTECTLTAVIHDPRMPFLPSDDLLYASSLESVADFTPDGSCLVLQTSSCIMEQYMRLGNEGRNVTYNIKQSAYTNPSLEELQQQQQQSADSNVTVRRTNEQAAKRYINDKDSALVLEAVSRNIYDRAGPRLRHWIDSGLVRLSILDHEKYNATSCTDFYKQFFLKSVLYWVDEFIGEEKKSNDKSYNAVIDSDTMFMFQRDVILCKPLTPTYLNPFSQFAYVGGSWKARGGGSKGVKLMWDDLANCPRRSTGGPSYNWTTWNQYWNTHVEPFYNPAFVDFNPHDALLSCDTLPSLRASSIFCPLPTFPYDVSDNDGVTNAAKDDRSNSGSTTSSFRLNGTKLGAIVNWPERYPLSRSEGIVGNGGASLRSRKWMIRAIRSCPSVKDHAATLDRRYIGINQCTAPGPWEDVYFSAVLNVIGAPLPTPFQSTLFAVENSYSNTFASRNETVVNETLASLMTKASTFATIAQSINRDEKEIAIEDDDQNYAYSWSSTSSLLDQYWDEIKTFGRAQAVAEHHCGKVTRCPNRRYCKYSPNKQW